MLHGINRRLAGTLTAALSFVLLIPAAVSAAESNGEPAMLPLLPATPVPEIELAPEGLDPTFHRAAATTFSPYDSTATWAYQGAGCRSRVAGSGLYDLGIQVPNGAVIDFLRVYYYDVDGTNDVAATLWSFDGAGNFTQLALAQGSGTPGYSSAGSGFFSHTVDTVSESLVVRLNLSGGTNSNLRICGVRIRYTDLASFIFADGFESGDTSNWSSTTGN